MKRVLVFYTYFYPAFKAGGPVQSLFNLVEELSNYFDFSIICSAYELGEQEVLTGVSPDHWNILQKNVRVFYATNAKVRTIKNLMVEVNPDVVYVNGMFTTLFSTLPIWLAKSQGKKVVVAPRGMLQDGALSVKPMKKKLFLFLFKVARLHAGVVWHATDNQEVLDIKKMMGRNAIVEIASNVPKRVAASRVPRTKAKGELKLVYLSLISAKKNLHVVLEALQLIQSNVQLLLDIFGPIKDELYMKKCEVLFRQVNHSVRYCGAVSPNDVQSVLQNYHALILPTRGENFGHAIFEAFSVGTPAIITPFTPWGVLQESSSGITVGSINPVDWSRAIENFLALDQDEFNVLSTNAYGLAAKYVQSNNFKNQYEKLFH